MTRRKDTLRNRTERVRISQQKRNSRLEKRKQENEKEKLQEKQLLLQVAGLPNELIRLIYAFMSGNAKLIFFPKYESLCHNGCPVDFGMGLDELFRKMSNTQMLDLIYTGTLLKYPEIIGAISYDYYYSLIDQDFHTVSGYQLLNLWVTGKLSYNFVQAEYSMDEESKRDIDGKMREIIASAMKNYVWNTLQEYRIVHRQVCYLAAHPHASNPDKKSVESYRDLFLRIEKAMYLIRVAERFLPYFDLNIHLIHRKKPWRTETIVIDSTYPFTNELLIPTPLSMPIQT